MTIMMVILLTFCLPLVASAEMKQLVCKQTPPITYWNQVLAGTYENSDASRKTAVEEVMQECDGSEYLQAYTLTFDSSLLKNHQRLSAELVFATCSISSRRPDDNGNKFMDVSVNELAVSHYGTEKIYIDRNTLNWKAENSFYNYPTERNLPCEIKDIDTSKRKL